VTQDEAEKLAKKIIEPYRRGNHVSVGVSDLKWAIADQLMGMIPDPKYPKRKQ
jgi:hypothetical protein